MLDRDARCVLEKYPWFATAYWPESLTIAAFVSSWTHNSHAQQLICRALRLPLRLPLRRLWNFPYHRILSIQMQWKYTSIIAHASVVNLVNCKECVKVGSPQIDSFGRAGAVREPAVIFSYGLTVNFPSAITVLLRFYGAC